MSTVLALLFGVSLVLMTLGYFVGYAHGRTDADREQRRERLLDRLEGH